MKYRSSFVTNSSSSSFICEVCGHSEVVYDGDRNDEFVRCEKGHEFCIEHMVSEQDVNVLREKLIQIINENIQDYTNDDYYKSRPEKQKQYIKEKQEELANIPDMDEDEIYDALREYDQNDIPASSCPICTLDHIDSSKIVSYIVKTQGKSNKEFETEIRSKFANLVELEKFLKENK